jgi:hypothetical protein
LRFRHAPIVLPLPLDTYTPNINSVGTCQKIILNHNKSPPTLFERQVINLYEAIEFFSMKVGLFFMLVTFPSTTIICHVLFDCLWNTSTIYIGCLISCGILVIFAILSFELCEVFGYEYCAVCSFYKEKEECIVRFFRFVNVLSLLPNVSWYFDWHLMTCA